MLQGWYDQIRPSIESLSQSIPRIFNPHLDFQRAAEAGVMKDPNLLHTYADLEKQSPGLLKSMNLGNIARLVQGIPESSSALAEKRKAKYLNSPTTPDEDDEIRANVLGTKTPKERKKEDLGLKKDEIDIKLSEYDEIIRKGMAEIAPTLQKGQLAEARRQMETLGEVGVGELAIRNVGGKVYESYLQGKLSPDQIRILTTNPHLKEVFESQRDDYWKQKGHDLSRELSRRLTRQEKIDDIMLQANLRWAQEVADYANASPADIIAFKNLPPDQQKNPQDEAGQKIAAAIQNIGIRRYQQMLLPAINSFNNATAKDREIILGTRKGNPQAALENINNQSRNIFGASGVGSPPQFKLDESGFMSRKRKLIMESGELAIASTMGFPVATPDEVAIVELKNKTASDPAKQQQIAAAILAQKGKLNPAEFQKLIDSTLEDLRPELAQQIRILLNKPTAIPNR
jgi:hypothetical protein